MESGTWTWFDHTADIGLEVAAPSLESLFSTAAHALFDLLIEPTADRQPSCLMKRVIEIDANNPPELLVRWLAELLYIHETSSMVLTRVHIRELSDDRIAGDVLWEPFDRSRHRLRREIKGVTYHQVCVEQQPAGWRARLVLDV